MDYRINQAPESQAFLKRVAALPDAPGVSLDAVLAPSVEVESELRRLYAQDRQNVRFANPYIGLVSLFDVPDSAGIHSTRPRVILTEDDRTAKHLFPLSDDRRRKHGEPCIVETLDEFRKNWAIFTEGALSQLTDWNNVIAAGGSVLGCLLPISQENKESRRTMRKYFHSSAYPTSDIDLFLWGLNSEQAEVKINQIYEAVRDSVPWDATCVRTKHAISIHSQYPYRSVQIVLRLYHSPGEILAGFDVDAPCVAYDGNRVLANPRSIVTLMRQANTVDMTRRSPSYEVRLAKYASRGFEVYVPELRRADVDPTIFERSLARITGLARLLVLERLARPEARVSYLESRRRLRSRAPGSTVYTRRMRRQCKGDLKADEEIVGLDMNDYDVATLHIPYGPGWTAKRIERLVYQTDLGMNSTFNPKNKDRHLHRHVAFFGTMKECVEDLCEYCPEPKDDAEGALQEEEDKLYVRGRIQFMEDDPGRQSMTGSFNPIDVGEWSELAYLGPVEKLFAAIVANDRASVLALLTSDEVDISRRDHVGRTVLHVAIMSAAVDVSADLVDAGVRMTARLVDGRTALHLAAQMDMPTIVEKMLTRSAYNAENAEQAETEAIAKGANNEKMALDEEDGSDQEVSDGEESEKGANGDREANSPNELNAGADIPDDNFNLPDVLDVNATDWDLNFTPLAYAIVNGSTRVVQVLLNAGADPNLATKTNNSQAALMHPLTLTLLQADDVRAVELIDQLVRGGASSAQADENLFSVFHALVRAGRTSLVEKILSVDPSANAAINVPIISDRQKVMLPLVSAIEKGAYAVAALLLGYGARVFISPEDVQKARNMALNYNTGYNHDRNPPHELDYLKDVFLPVEVALARHSYMVSFLIDMGAQVSVPIGNYLLEGRYRDGARQSLLDAVYNQVDELKKELSVVEDVEDQQPEFAFTENPRTRAEYRRTVQGRITDYLETVHGKDLEDEKSTPLNAGKQEARRALAFFEEMGALLRKANAKTFDEIFPNNPPSRSKRPTQKDVSKLADRTQFTIISKQRAWMKETVLPHLLDRYDALFEACWTGNNARIEELCLPRKGCKSDKAPIQISVATERLKVDRPAGMAYIYDSSSDGIYTPFSVAVLARNWTTAGLILAIASAQHKPKEDTGTKRFNPKGLILGEDDSDSDSNSDLSDDESMDVDGSGKVVGSFIDLASRSSAVQCDVSPEELVSYSVSSRVNQVGNSIVHSDSIMAQACADGDLETFVAICDIMQQLPESQRPDMTCLLCAFEADSPEVVDEIIRRSGIGVNLDHLTTSEGGTQQTGVKSLGRLYLGLTVHGKKRKDLAKRVDGHVAKNPEEVIIPLLWTAIQRGAKKVVEYLSGPGPLAAYRHYATTKRTEKAEGLNKIKDLEKQLPALLGIIPNSCQETALTAAILGPAKEKRLTMAKQIISLFHSQAKTFLQSPVAFSRWTPLHLAVAENLEPAFIDYLFSNGLSAESTDRHGMNVYHIVCQLGHKELLEYLLKKLPQDITSNLLTQKTRLAEETPLMLAVLAGQHEIVDVLLRSGANAVNECLTIRDAEGSMPLHTAAQRGFAKIASSLIEHSVDSEALHSENGVGETPIETATVRWLLYVTCDGFMSKMPTGYGQNQYPNLNFRGTMKTPGPLTKDKLVAEIILLENVRTSLEISGKLAANEKLKIALDSFIAYLTQKCAVPSDFTEVPATFNSDTDDCDRWKTYNVLFAATLASPGRRRLVHLVDVQRSVHSSLEGAVRKSTTVVVNDRTQRKRLSKLEELPDEVDGEAMWEFEQWKGVLKWGIQCRRLAGRLATTWEAVNLMSV